MDIRKLCAVLPAAMLALSLSASAAPTHLTGTVTDSMCGLHHMLKDKPAKCTRDCVKSGSSYALAVHGRVITLAPLNAPAKAALNRFAAQKVTLTGHYSGKIFDVTRVVELRR